MDVSKSSDIQIKIKMPNPNKEPPTSPKAQKDDLKDMDVLCTFKIMVKSQNLDQGCINSQWTYPNRYQDAKPQAETSSICQSPKWGLKEHECSLHLQNQGMEPLFGSWVYQKPVSISKSRSWYQTPISNLKYPLKLWLWVNQRPVDISKSRWKYQPLIWDKLNT